MANIQRARYRVTLSDSAYAGLAEPMPGLFPIGIVSRAGHLSGLAHDIAGNFFAVNGRAIEPLKKEKIAAAMAHESIAPAGQN